MSGDRKGKLEVRRYETRSLLGQAAAEMLAVKLKELLAESGDVNIVFAAAPSQNEFLAALRQQPGIDWSRVNAFHMDEYIGLPPDAPQGFGNFLKERIFSRLPLRSVNYINGGATDPEEECERYEELLQSLPPHIVCMGIGENNHIAFNDPHVADFNDPRAVKIVELDQECRQQQVNDECFRHIAEVPRRAITLTVPTLMQAGLVYCMVPGKNKARAVYNTFQQEIDPRFPSTILREHPAAILFLDRESARLLRDLATEDPS